MVTVPEIVEQIVKRSPLLEEGLASRIINLSSLARKIQPEIQKKLFKNIQVGAIIMALKRLEQRLSTSSNKYQNFLSTLGDLTVRSNLVEFTFTNSPTLLEKLGEVLSIVDKEKNSFLTFSHGVFETTLIVSSFLEKKVRHIFKAEQMKSKFTQLSAITIILPKETVEIPGVYYQLLKTLAWEGINIVEIVSNYTELTLVLEDKEINNAFSALNKP